MKIFKTTLLKALRALALMLVMGVLPSAAMAQSQVFVYGDVNKDLEVNIADVNAIVKNILGTASYQDADVNNDGEINIADINKIIGLILNTEEVSSNVHVYGETPTSEGSVVSVTDDRVVVACRPDEVPQPDEIIVSGVTAIAPTGFLRRVVSVQGAGGVYEIVTTNASLEEIMPEGDYTIPVPMFEEGREITIEAPGQAPQRAKFSTEFKLGLKARWPDTEGFDFKLISDVKPSDENEVLYGAQDTYYPFSAIVKVKPEAELKFIWNTHHAKVQRVGLSGEIGISTELLAKISLGMDLKDALGKQGVHLFTVNLEPVTVVIGLVPLVFTPRIDFFLNADLNGEIYLQTKIFSASADASFSYIYTPTPDPLTGKKHNLYHDASCSAQSLFSQMKLFASKMGLEGSVKVKLSPTTNVSLYGANDVFNVGIPITPWAKAKAEFALNLGDMSDVGLDIDDDITLSAGVDLGLEAQFKLGRTNEVWKQDITLFEEDLFTMSLTPDFDDLEVAPDEDPIPASVGQVRFSMYMTRPIMEIFPFEDYGFVYGIPGQPHQESWHYLSMKEEYDQDFTPSHFTQYIETYVPIADLEKGKTYHVCPYVKIFGINILNKDKEFTIVDDIDPSTGDEFRDLGLPSGTLWSIHNLGAEQSVDIGSYYAWGETTGFDEGKTSFSWSNYKYAKGTHNSLTKYCTLGAYGYNGFTDGLTKLQAADDPASALYGYSYGIPTKEEWDELISCCTWKKLNDGVWVTGPNGKGIFLPAAGYRNSLSLYDSGVSGYYWSSTLDELSPDDAWFLYFSSGIPSAFDYYRSYGRSIRPVMRQMNTTSPSAPSVGLQQTPQSVEKRGNGGLVVKTVSRSAVNP